MTWGICKISPGHSTASDLGLWCETFSQSRKCMKVYRGVTYHEKRNDRKSEEELTCQFKIDLRNLTNFALVNQKSQTFAL